MNRTVSGPANPSPPSRPLPQCTGDPDPPAPPEDPEFPDDIVRAALLDRAAPWSVGLPPWMFDHRADAVRDMKRAELLEEILWLRRKFGPQLQAWKRWRIAAALGQEFW